MTEADFSGAILQESGAMILAAWLKHKVQHDSDYSMLVQTNCVFDQDKGSLASLDISNNSIGSAQEAIIKQICAGRSIKCAL